MAENQVISKRPNIETVKRLLLEDLNRNNDSIVDQHESTFCEDDEPTPVKKLDVSRTYSRPTPQKRVFRSLENTLYSPRPSPNNIHKQKRKKIEVEEDDSANKSIVEITEQFKKVDEFQLAVE